MPTRPSLDDFLRRAAAVGATVALVGGVHAQTNLDLVRAQVASARLGAGYAQMINLSATPDLSAASYRIDGPDPRFRPPATGADTCAVSPTHEGRGRPVTSGRDLFLGMDGRLDTTPAMCGQWPAGLTPDQQDFTCIGFDPAGTVNPTPASPRRGGRRSKLTPAFFRRVEETSVVAGVPASVIRGGNFGVGARGGRLRPLRRVPVYTRSRSTGFRCAR